MSGVLQPVLQCTVHRCKPFKVQLWCSIYDTRFEAAPDTLEAGALEAAPAALHSIRLERRLFNFVRRSCCDRLWQPVPRSDLTLQLYHKHQPQREA